MSEWARTLLVGAGGFVGKATVIFYRAYDSPAEP
jgi:hypothetical protein